MITWIDNDKECVGIAELIDEEIYLYYIAKSSSSCHSFFQNIELLTKTDKEMDIFQDYLNNSINIVDSGLEQICWYCYSKEDLINGSYTAEELFDELNDLTAYPETDFIPKLCQNKGDK